MGTKYEDEKDGEIIILDERGEETDTERDVGGKRDNGSRKKKRDLGERKMDE